MICIVTDQRQVVQVAVLQAVVLQEDDGGAVSCTHPVVDVPGVRLSSWANMLQQPLVLEVVADQILQGLLCQCRLLPVEPLRRTLQVMAEKNGNYPVSFPTTPVRPEPLQVVKKASSHHRQMIVVSGSYYP